MKNYLIIVFLFLTEIYTIAHPWKPKHRIIIDTDCGFDDFRTICMLLSATDISVLGIVTSNGVLNAQIGYLKLNALLSDLHHEGIFIGVSSNEETTAKNCSSALKFEWGVLPDSTVNIRTAKEAIESILRHTIEPVEYICLGSLNTVAGLYKNSQIFREQIQTVLWSSEYLMNEDNFNYSIDKDAFRYITEETQLKLNIINGSDSVFHYEPHITDKILQLGNSYSNKIYQSLTSVQIPYANSFYDEHIALYLHDNKLFIADTMPDLIYNALLPEGQNNIEDSFLALVKGYSGNQNQVLDDFPMDSSFYQPDIQKIIYPTIEKYGIEEWIACVMTNEMHRHLGVYATIGAKMGIRAREYFGAGIDELEIVSYAGSNPPFSCMNDGLQVSTGATLGHGLIKIASDTLNLPEAEFFYMGRKIKISLKEKYRIRIEREIREYNLVYGVTSDFYWEMVRNAALNHWTNWSRHEIFTIEE
ncbi:MAG: nucleoside hydrolase [Bacteroidales bacterium]|nr:nucleoside hydrolase [Bacteroidales bacterium]